MPFVPIVPPRHRSASARTEELGRRIREVVETFRSEHPDLKVREIQEAMRIALVGVRASSQSALALLGLTLGVIGGLFAFAFLFGNAQESRLPAIAVAVLAAFVALVMVKLRNRA